MVGIKTLAAIELAEKPTVATLHVLQMSIEAHKVGLSAMERSNCLARIRQELGYSVVELAGQVHMKQPLVSKLLAFQRRDGAIKQMLHAGEIDMERAYIVSQEPDVAKQRELVTQSGKLSRDQLRQRAKTNGPAAETKASVARFALAGGVRVTVQGPELTLGAAIEALQQAGRELKRGQSQGLDISTQQRVMRDRAKAK